MEKSEFLKESFCTIREEIKATKARIYWTVAMGLFGVPVLVWLAQSAQNAEAAGGAEGTAKFVSLLVPYLVLVVIVLFLSEQNALMRAGSFVRQVIEPKVDESSGWEAWLGKRAEWRLMDKHFFACFMLVFFLYYFMSVGLALQSLMPSTQHEASTTANYWLIGASVTYAIGAIWALSTLLQHWRSCTTTGPEDA